MTALPAEVSRPARPLLRDTSASLSSELILTVIDLKASCGLLEPSQIADITGEDEDAIAEIVATYCV